MEGRVRSSGPLLASKDAVGGHFETGPRPQDGIPHHVMHDILLRPLALAHASVGAAGTEQACSRPTMSRVWAGAQRTRKGKEKKEGKKKSKKNLESPDPAASSAAGTPGPFPTGPAKTRSQGHTPGQTHRKEMAST